jgi:carbon-monoxide dehydrogenase medium subunit
MRPVQFDYLRPASVNEALGMLAAHPGAKVLSGGHSLIPSMNQRLAQPELLIDISRIADLKGVRISSDGITIGAATPHAVVAADTNVRLYDRAVAQACNIVGDPQVRTWGTIGGNLAHADPASDPPTAVLACGGKLNLAGPNGTRTVNASDFFIDLFTTDLHPDELLVNIMLPNVAGRKSAYAKLPHPASRYAVAGVAVAFDFANGMCQNASVAVGGATPKATLSAAAAQALNGTTLADAALDAAANALMQDVSSVALGDIYASADYRTAMCGVLLKRAVHAALG